MNIAHNTLMQNKQRITAIELEVYNPLGHHTVKVWFNDVTYTIATARKPYEAKVYKSLSASLTDILRLGFKEFKVNYHGV